MSGLYWDKELKIKNAELRIRDGGCGRSRATVPTGAGTMDGGRGRSRATVPTEAGERQLFLKNK